MEKYVSYRHRTGDSRIALTLNHKPQPTDNIGSSVTLAFTPSLARVNKIE